MTAVAPPPIVKYYKKCKQCWNNLLNLPIANNADMISKIPIDKYKSKSNESLMNSAPLNKSALEIVRNSLRPK